MAPSSKDPRLIDLGELTRSLQLSAKPRETSKETQSGLAREEADAAHLRHKDLLVTRSVLLTVGVVSVVCIIVLFLPRIPPENAKWATTLLTMVVSGGLGHMTGKASK